MLDLKITPTIGQNDKLRARDYIKIKIFVPHCIKYKLYNTLVRWSLKIFLVSNWSHKRKKLDFSSLNISLFATLVSFVNLSSTPYTSIYFLILTIGFFERKKN
jgi:hypothetical protein